jgi:hypothetical protein
LLQEELAYLQNPLAVNRPKRAWLETLQWPKKRVWRMAALGAVASVVVGIGVFSFTGNPPTEENRSTSSQAPKQSTFAITPNVTVSTAPLWNEDGTREVQSIAAQFEAHAHALPQDLSSEPDPWTKQVQQLEAGIQRYEMSDEDRPRTIAPSVPSIGNN